MQMMRREAIIEALTNNRHFEQELCGRVVRISASRFTADLSAFVDDNILYRLVKSIEAETI